MSFKQMKGVMKLLHLGIAGLVCLASCVAENEIANEAVPDGKNVRLGINTRSFNDGTDEQVNTIRIIQVARTIAQSVKTNRFINSPTDPLSVEGLTGNYDIYVIANESNDGSKLTALDNVGSLSELKEIVLPYAVASRSQTNIPMLGVVKDVTIGLPTSGQPSSTNLGTVKVGSVDNGNTLPVTLTRLAVRIDLTIKSKSFADLVSVRFTGLPDGISLFGNEYETANNIQQAVTVSGNAFANVTPVSTGYILEKKKEAIIIPSYLFVPTTDGNKAASVEVYLDGKPEPFKAKIGHAASPSAVTKDYTLHPNTHYTLTALIAGDELTIESQVRNWDKNEVDYPAGGGSFWKSQPKDTRVGIGESTVIYTEFGGNGTGSTFKWYRKKQLADFTFSIEEITVGITNTDYTDFIRSELSLTGNALDDACEVYCVASITAPDGHQDRLESEYATFMVMGDEVKPAGTYPAMQNWKAPLNVPLGSTCLLQDNRDDKVYRVKLMADDNWWMIQDLAYGNTSTENDFRLYYALNTVPEKSYTIDSSKELYGLALGTGLSTGGLLYNAHAALQLPGLPSDIAENSLNYTLLPSICPDGWHLPGNWDGIFNQEWKNLLSKCGSQMVFTGMKYNSSKEFNAYTKLVGMDSYAFHGGYRCERMFFGGDILYITSMVREDNGSQAAAYDDIGNRLNTNMGAPIRCLRNFK